LVVALSRAKPSDTPEPTLAHRKGVTTGNRACLPRAAAAPWQGACMLRGVCPCRLFGLWLDEGGPWVLHGAPWNARPRLYLLSSSSGSGGSASQQDSGGGGRADAPGVQLCCFVEVAASALCACVGGFRGMPLTAAARMAGPQHGR
jgi:hypothetical protein